MEAKIIAFVSGITFPPGDQPEENPNLFRKFLRTNREGTKILMAFGQKLFNEIIWLDLSHRFPGQRREPENRDYDWMEKALASEKPDLVLALGEKAATKLLRCYGAVGRKVLTLEARLFSVNQTEMDDFAIQVNDWRHLHRIKI